MRRGAGWLLLHLYLLEASSDGLVTAKTMREDKEPLSPSTEEEEGAERGIGAGEVHPWAVLWTPWSAWSVCVRGENIRVRACSTLKGFRCRGPKQQTRDCRRQPETSTSPPPSTVPTSAQPFLNFVLNADGVPEVDYESLDPWKEDRLIAMEQLFGSTPEPKTTPRPSLEQRKMAAALKVAFARAAKRAELRRRALVTTTTTTPAPPKPRPTSRGPKIIRISVHQPPSPRRVFLPLRPTELSLLGSSTTLAPATPKSPPKRKEPKIIRITNTGFPPSPRLFLPLPPRRSSLHRDLSATQSLGRRRHNLPRPRLAAAKLWRSLRRALKRSQDAGKRDRTRRFLGPPSLSSLPDLLRSLRRERKGPGNNIAPPGITPQPALAALPTPPPRPGRSDWGTWSAWSGCACGRRSRTRHCGHSGDCAGIRLEVEACEVGPACAPALAPPSRRRAPATPLPQNAEFAFNGLDNSWRRPDWNPHDPSPDEIRRLHKVRADLNQDPEPVLSSL